MTLVLILGSIVEAAIVGGTLVWRFRLQTDDAWDAIDANITVIQINVCVAAFNALAAVAIIVAKAVL